MAKDDNIGGRLVEGTIWYVSARWIIKFIGIASSAILIRLLTPEDFGIIAKAFFILWLFEDFITLNFSHGLVRLKDPDKEDYDTAFTLNVITGLALFLLINISAYGIYYFFDQSDIAMIVHIFSLRPVFMALESPRIIDLQKDLNFRKDFIYLVTHRMLFVIFSVSACYYFRDYYGLIATHIFGALSLCILSYCFMPYVPKLTIKKRHALMDFSLPMMRANVFTNILSSIDRMLPAYFISNRIMGIYNFSHELSFQLTNEVLYPLSRALFPIFSKIEDDKEELSKHYFNVLQFMIASCSAIGLGLYLIAEPLIHFYAGDQWIDAIPYFKILALVGVFHVFSQIHASIFEGTGYVKLREKLVIIQVIITLLCILPFVINIDLYKLVLVKLAVTALFSLLYIALSIKFYHVPIKNLIVFCTRITISLLALYGAYNSIPDNLFVQICVCGIAFIATDFALWGVTKNPKMIEAKLINLAKQKLFKS